MSFHKEEDFNQNMRQLISLLKKMLKNLPHHEQLSQLSSFFKDSGINLNLCFFTFLPVSSEDMDELEELYDPLWQEERNEDLSRELSPEDMDFLRKNGIRF